MLGLPPFFKEIYEPMGREEAEKDYQKTLANVKRLIAEYYERDELAGWKPPNLAAIALVIILIFAAPRILPVIRAIPKIATAFHQCFMEPWWDAEDGPLSTDVWYEITEAYDTDSGCCIKIGGKWMSVSGRSAESIFTERALYKKACETEDWSEYDEYVFKYCGAYRYDPETDTCYRYGGDSP